MPDLVQRQSVLAPFAAVAPEIPDATLAVLPDAARLSFRGRQSTFDAAGDAFGMALPREACRFNSDGDRTAFWLGPDEWLLQSVGEDPAALLATVSAKLVGQPSSVVDVSHRSQGFSIAGPQAAYVLNHGCPLDLSLSAFPVGMCTRTVYAKATIMLSRPAPDVFHIDVWRSFAPYVWQLLDEARSELV
ncbi:sarcosine oxidase subunit gamma [soil metagenome]